MILPLSSKTKELLQFTEGTAKEAGHTCAVPAHILFCLLNQDRNMALNVLKKNKRVKLKRLENRVRSSILKNPEVDKDFNGELNKEARSKTPYLYEFGSSLTQKARNNKFDPVIGREEEIDQLMKILARRTKNNAILIGEPGTTYCRHASSYFVTG